MSRYRENKALPSQTRANGSVFGHIGSGSFSGGSGDFFTDSLLEDTSRIPSPAPAKKTGLTSVSAKPRRALHSSTSSLSSAAATATRPLQTTRHSASAAHGLRKAAPLKYDSGRQTPVSPSTSAQPPSNASRTTPTDTAASQPHQNDVVTTPPQSDIAAGGFRTSTNSDLSTPPRALTEVYQRIDDEQELAAAEREDRSSEGESDRHTDLPLDTVDDRSPSTKSGQVDLQLSGTVSEGTGMSFLGGFTDQNIANSITPAVSRHVKDMRKLGISTKPITFNPGTKPSERLADDDDLGDDEEGDDDERALDWSKSMRLPTEPKKLFPLSGRLHSHDVDKSHSENTKNDKNSDSDDRKPPSRLLQLPFSTSQPRADQQVDNGARRDEADDGNLTDEELLKRERAFTFGQFAKKMNSRSSQAGSDETGGRHSPRPEKATSSASRAEGHGHTKHEREQSSDRHPQHERAPSFTSQASSSVNWEAIGKESPIPSIEPAAGSEALPSPPASETSASVRSQNLTSPSKRWDNDFTGASFQVSESPPVKSRARVQDYVRQTAASRLSKSAIATGRRDPVREPDKNSNQGPPGSLSRSTSHDSVWRPDAKAGQNEDDGQTGPDTPAAIFRSPTSSKKDFTPNSEVKRSAVHGRSTSYDLMQRLARLGSTTPRNSPPPVRENLNEDAKEASAAIDDTSATKDDVSAAGSEAEKGTAEKKVKPSVAATPKVTGAWTDTILPDPDTVKTIKPSSHQQAKYEETPHVKAGGWVDTPLPNRHGRTSTARMDPIEDVTEDLDTNVVPAVKAEADQSPGQDESKLELSISRAKKTTEVVKVPPPPHSLSAAAAAAAAAAAVVPKSAWASIREQQKQRGVSTEAADRTLDLGTTTIGSLDSMLDETLHKADDLIKLGGSGSRSSEANALADADTMQIELILLGTLQTLQRHIQNTRQGISQLEQDMATDVAASDADDTALGRAAAAAAAASLQHQEAQEKVLLDLIARLPLLPGPNAKKADDARLSSLARRLSSSPPSSVFVAYLLGLFLLTCGWYLMECTLAEALVHPLVAENYSWPDPASKTPLPAAAAAAAAAATLPPTGLILPSLVLRWITGVGDSSNIFHTLWTSVTSLAMLAFSLGRAVYRAVAMALGWTDGFVDHAVVGAGDAVIDTVVSVATAAVVATVSASSASASSSVFFGMDNDEFM